MHHPIPTERLTGLLDPRAGLDDDEVVRRRQQFGGNDIVPHQAGGWWPVLRDALGDPMVWFLVVASGLYAWMGDRVESTILAIALVPILGMDLWLHRRTRASTEGLAGQLEPRAFVSRHAHVGDIEASGLVPGDLVRVRGNEHFPADGIIVLGELLQVDESTLTGESLPQPKHPLPRPTEAWPDRIEHGHWASAGTRLISGEAWVRVVHTGSQTLYGDIVRSARQGRQSRTPVQQAVSRLVRVLVLAATALCLALAATRLAQGHGWVDALLSAVTLAIAALPEEFPVVMTLFLGVGVFRLARHHALVRRAVVVEDIGRVSCICTDKTGTLTEGRLALVGIIPADGIDEATLLAAAATASRRDSGDPLDQAILARATPLQGEERARLVFTEDRRREVVVIAEDVTRTTALAKGAPETILASTGLEVGERVRWMRVVEDASARGERVIGCARRSVADAAGKDATEGFEWLGLLAFADPLRASARSAVAEARAAGIRVIMVTGDHSGTALAIAREAGIGDGDPRVIEGGALARAISQRDPAVLSSVDVVARCLPTDKASLVGALQASGEHVAVTGDGVNDVPALQAADVGIAMGGRGSRSAREAAAIVLLDDNFGSIVRAIAEGRQLFANLRLSFAYLILIHVPFVLSAALVPFAGFELLFLPIHVVWLELLIHPTAMLAFQQRAGRGRLMTAPARGDEGFFSRRAWRHMALLGLGVTAAVTLAFMLAIEQGVGTAQARGVSIATLILAGAGYTAALARLDTTVARVLLALSLVSTFVLVQVPFTANLLHIEPLTIGQWAYAACVGAIAWLLARPLAEARGRPSTPVPGPAA